MVTLTDKLMCTCLLKAENDKTEFSFFLFLETSGIKICFVSMKHENINHNVWVMHEVELKFLFY